MSEGRPRADGLHPNMAEPQVSTPLVARLATQTGQADFVPQHAIAMASRWRVLTCLHLCLAFTGLLHVVLEPFARNFFLSGWWSGAVAILTLLTFLVAHCRVKAIKFNLLHPSVHCPLIFHSVWMGVASGVAIVAVAVEILVVTKPGVLDVKDSISTVDYIRAVVSILQFLFCCLAFTKVLSSIFHYATNNAQPIVYLSSNGQITQPSNRTGSYGSMHESDTDDAQPMAFQPFQPPNSNPHRRGTDMVAAGVRQPSQEFSERDVGFQASVAVSTVADVEGRAAFPSSQNAGFAGGFGSDGQGNDEHTVLLK